MKNVIISCCLITVIVCCKNGGINVSEYEALQKEVKSLKDSITQLKGFSHFRKIKPIIYSSPVESNLERDFKTLNAFLAADGLLINGVLVNLKVESSNEHIRIFKTKGMHKIVYNPDSIDLEADTVYFKFMDPKGLRSIVFPIKIPEEVN